MCLTEKETTKEIQSKRPGSLRKGKSTIPKLLKSFAKMFLYIFVCMCQFLTERNLDNVVPLRKIVKGPSLKMNKTSPICLLRRTASKLKEAEIKKGTVQITFEQFNNFSFCCTYVLRHFVFITTVHILNLPFFMIVYSLPLFLRWRYMR